MGQRANLMIMEKSKHTLYYSHWCANTLDVNLFWGPDYATDFIRIQQGVDESGWLNNVWAEGGAVVDHDNKVLLFFSGEDVRFDVPWRRIYLQMLGRVWQGWKIRWAYEGIADMADYVGYPRSKVLAENESKYKRSCSLDAPEEKDWTGTVASVRFADGTQLFYPLPAFAETYLTCGPDLVKDCERQKGYTFLPLDEWLGDAFPDGGFYIDVERQQLDYWIAADAPGVPEQIAQIWTGWIVNWQRDAFETQLADGGGQLRFPTRSDEALRKQITDRLLVVDSYNPANAILEIAEKMRQEGQDVKIDPRALRDDHLDIPIEKRRQIIESALL